MDVVTETQSSHLISNRTLAQMPSGPCPPITARHQHPQPAVRYLTRASIRIRDVIDRGGPGDAQASTSVTTGERTAAPVQSVSVRQQRASHEYRQDHMVIWSDMFMVKRVTLQVKERGCLQL